MYNCKIKFTKKAEEDELDDDEIFEKIENYWCALANNGQALGGFYFFSDDESAYLTTVIPEDDTLSGAYNNDYVRERLQKLRGIFDIELHLTTAYLYHKTA